MYSAKERSWLCCGQCVEFCSVKINVAYIFWCTRLLYNVGCCTGIFVVRETEVSCVLCGVCSVKKGFAA